MKGLKFKKTISVFILVGIIAIVYQIFTTFFTTPKKITKIATSSIQLAKTDEIQQNIQQYNQNPKHLKTSDIILKQIPKSVPISSNMILGGVYIPSKKITIPITYSNDKKLANNSAVVLKDNQKLGEGNFVVGSNSTNNKKLLFSTLLTLNKKEKIFVTDKKTIYLYEVSSRERVNKSRTDILDDVSNKKLLTLITRFKNKDTDKLIVIKAELKASAPYQDAGNEIKGIFGGENGD